jgi:endonuclease-8
MPEGDTIHAHAAELTPKLIGKPLLSVHSRGVEMRGLRGCKVTKIEALGKHLLMAFDEGTAVRVHLGINGNWRTLARASTATLGQAELALMTADAALVCKARTIEWTRARFAAGMRALTQLGPDLLAEAPDLDAILARARQPRYAARPIGELLLTQAVAAGVGNVYKCELLFLRGIHPWTRVDALDDATLRGLFEDATRWLRSNLGRQRTLTADLARGELPARGRGRFWVYGRLHRACYRCGAAIEQRRQGEQLRPTFWCPRCQAMRSGADGI